MDLKIIIVAVVVLLSLFYYYYYIKQSFEHSEKKTVITVAPVNAPKVPVIEKDYNEIIAEVSLDPSIADSHNQYVANVRQFSSGANFSAISDDNTSPIFTNFIGFSRPQYVEVDETARQVPDIDTSVLKRNKRLAFTNDYGL